MTGSTGVIEGTDEPSRIFVLTHPLPDRDADVAYAPSNEEVCTVDASLAQFARAVHTWKSGHYFFDHFVSDFQHVLSSAHQDRKMTYPEFPPFLHSEIVYRH